MPDWITVTVDGEAVTMPAGSSAAAAILQAGVTAFRTSVNGHARGPLCGMGICFECRVTIDGIPLVKSCQTVCKNGMVIETLANSVQPLKTVAP